MCIVCNTQCANELLFYRKYLYVCTKRKRKKDKHKIVLRIDLIQILKKKKYFCYQAK